MADELTQEIVVAVPVDPALRMDIPYKPRAGFTIATCMRCSTQVYLGPVSKIRIDQHKAGLLCCVCALVTLGPEAIKNVKPLT